MTRRVMVKVWQILLLYVPVVILTACNDGERRPGPEYQGSAHWALTLAQPTIDTLISNGTLGTDWKIYVISGARVDTTGRLFTNVGGWNFWVWSQSKAKQATVTVEHDGEIKTKLEDKPTAPGRGNPIPVGWLNSTDIFRAAQPHVGGPTKEVQIVVFNFTSYPEAPNEAVWGLSYSHNGGAHKVKWDGTYLSGS